jgi:hypothetical protein
MARKAKAVKLNAIEGGDILIGTDSADQFILREGQGDIVVEGFDRSDGDRALFDFGGYSDVLFLGGLSDGLEFTSFAGTHFSFHSVDANGDGIMDTRIDVNGTDSITLLGVGVDSLTGAALMGG